MNMYNPNVHGLSYKHILASTNEFYICKKKSFKQFLLIFIFFGKFQKMSNKLITDRKNMKLTPKIRK